MIATYFPYPRRTDRQTDKLRTRQPDLLSATPSLLLADLKRHSAPAASTITTIEDADDVKVAVDEGLIDDSKLRKYAKRPPETLYLFYVQDGFWGLEGDNGP